MARTPEPEGWAKALASQVPMTHPAWNVTRSEATETDVTGDTVESDIVPAGEGSAQEQSTVEPRVYTTAEIANRFRLLRTGDARTPDEEPIVEADLANTKRTLVELENQGHRFHHGAPSEDY